MKYLIETSANQVFLATDHSDPELSHVWVGVEMKKAKGGSYVEKKNGSTQFVRKLGSKILATV